MRWLYALPLLLTAQTTPPPATPPAPTAVVPAVRAADPAAPATQPVPPVAAEPAVVPLADQLRFGENGPRMTVPVEIADAGPFDFIIDTGAQRTVISRDLATTLRLRAGRGVNLMAMDGSSRASTVVIPSVRVSTLGTERIEAPLLEARNLGAPGMLGIDALQGHSVAIDFDAKTMAVQPSRKREKRVRLKPDEILVRAKSLFGQLVVTDAFVGSTRVRVVLDTGSVVTIGNNALRRALGRGRRVKPIEVISVTGGTLLADAATLNDVKLGELTLNNLPVAYADAAPFRTFGLDDKPAILLGMDALKLFRRIHIDFANREVRLALPRDTRRPSFYQFSAASPGTNGSG